MRTLLNVIKYFGVFDLNILNKYLSLTLKINNISYKNILL